MLILLDELKLDFNQTTILHKTGFWFHLPVTWVNYRADAIVSDDKFRLKLGICIPHTLFSTWLAYRYRTFLTLVIHMPWNFRCDQVAWAQIAGRRCSIIPHCIASTTLVTPYLSYWSNAHLGMTAVLTLTHSIVLPPVYVKTERRYGYKCTFSVTFSCFKCTIE